MRPPIIMQALVDARRYDDHRAAARKRLGRPVAEQSAPRRGRISTALGHLLGRPL
jgi:hypothetical protein